MSTNKIFCFGDGYAAGHIWPEWPQILQALLPDHKVITQAGIGAGPEWIVTCIVNSLTDLTGHSVIVQWPQPNRFDKIINNDRWRQIVATDPHYNSNLYTVGQHTWWLSSASQLPQITQYHDQYVCWQQHQQRSGDYQQLVKHALANLQCHYVSDSVQNQITYSQAGRFKEIRQREVQPSPMVHFCYLVEHLLPQLNVSVSEHRLLQLQKEIHAQAWIPYDPDRQSIWEDLVNRMSAID